MTNLDSILKSRDITLLTKVRIVKAIVFPVVMWELDHKEGWVLKNWCFWIVLLEKTPWTAMRSNQSLKGNQPWIFFGKIDAEAEALILWPPDMKSRLIRNDPNTGKDWRQEKGTTRDEMVGWHHWLNGHKFEQTLGDGEGQGRSLARCSSWRHKRLDTTEVA